MVTMSLSSNLAEYPLLPAFFQTRLSFVNDNRENVTECLYLSIISATIRVWRNVNLLSYRNKEKRLRLNTDRL